ncbi:amidohydrolase family protein [Chelatococcus asaccharovorans]|nr:amidohydrolase family protein [Chelatococcus asaccharovorans]MBS7705481.1 amidohydrolase [Chelatococcus asaccharovorans]
MPRNNLCENCCKDNMHDVMSETRTTRLGSALWRKKPMHETGGTETRKIVDCDVHPLIKSVDALSPYLSSRWRERFVPRSIGQSSSNGFVFARARDRYPHPNTTYRLDALPPNGGPAGSDPEFVLSDLIEPHGITTALLLPQEHYGVVRFSSAEAAAVFERANNEYLIDQWLAVDNRFALALTVSEHDPVAAAQSIRDLGRREGVVGVQLLINKTMLGSRLFDPIYAAAQDMGLAIVSHQNGSEGCYSFAQGPAGGAPRFYGERHSVLPQVGAANVVDMIMSGVFERFPELRVVMVEWGFSWLGALMSRADHLWMKNRSAAPHLKHAPSEYVVKHFKFATQPLDEASGSKEFEAMFGIPELNKMLVFSSDYPHYDTDAPDVILGKIPEPMKDAVYWQNALDAFGSKIFRN